MSKYKGFLIYGLKDPLTNEIRYIGRSSSGLKRPTEHFRPHKLKQKSKKSSWIKSCLNKGYSPEIVILEKFNDFKQLNQAEKRWIKYYNDLGHKLTNHTKGGDGINGYRHSKETKRKISEASKKQWLNDSTIKCKKISKGVSEYFSKNENRLKAAKLKGAKPFIVFKNNEVIGKWESIRQCSRQLKLDSGSISRVLKGEYKHTRGYSLKYA